MVGQCDRTTLPVLQCGQLTNEIPREMGTVSEIIHSDYTWVFSGVACLLNMGLNSGKLILSREWKGCRRQAAAAVEFGGAAAIISLATLTLSLASPTHSHGWAFLLLLLLLLGKLLSPSDAHRRF